MFRYKKWTGSLRYVDPVSNQVGPAIAGGVLNISQLGADGRISGLAGSFDPDWIEVRPVEVSYRAWNEDPNFPPHSMWEEFIYLPREERYTGREVRGQWDSGCYHFAAVRGWGFFVRGRILALSDPRLPPGIRSDGAFPPSTMEVFCVPAGCRPVEVSLAPVTKDKIAAQASFIDCVCRSVLATKPWGDGKDWQYARDLAMEAKYVVDSAKQQFDRGRLIAAEEEMWRALGLTQQAGSHGLGHHWQRDLALSDNPWA